MAKYSYEVKKQVVEAYLRGEGGYTYLAEKYGVTNRRQVLNWVHNYQRFGDSGLLRSRKNNDYSFEFKLAIVESYLSGEASCRELALENGINNAALVNKWIIDFRAAGPDALRPHKKGRKKTLDKPKIKSQSRETEERIVDSAHLSNGDHAINSKAKLSGVAKHNLRKYHSKDYNKENIVVLCGTDKLMEDVKKVYKEQFDEAVKKYNQKQTRDDRKIDDYFEKVCNSKNKDIAVELIFQLGDKDYWDRNEEKKKNMDVVAVPVGRGFKNGMETQVSKRKVCTKEFLEDVLQGSMRKFVSANLFTWISELNLKSKEFGRNHDLSVAEYKVKAENERAEKMAKENAESEKELNETIAKQTVAEKELKDTYKELEVVGDVADLGKNIKKLETMVRKGPDAPKGMITAKGYREKVVIPYIDKLYGVFRNVVDFAKGCFAQLKEVTEKCHEVSEINESLRRQNSNLREQIQDQEKEIDEPNDSKEKLGYFETFFRKEDYDRVIEMGEEQDKRYIRSR